MIFEVLTEVTFVACFGNGVPDLRQFHTLHVTEFGYEFVVALL
jgi:hypothetical protein